MIKKFFSTSKLASYRSFSTYYRSGESHFNLALTVNGKNLLDKAHTQEVLEKINRCYKNNVHHIIIKLKENHDENDIKRIVQKIKQLYGEYPELKIQGLQYSMALKQPTKEFLTNEFQFALTASKHIKESSKLGTYFLIESEDMFNTVIESKDQKLIDEMFFNLDILKQTQQNLNFTTPVLLLKYFKNKIDRALFEKFQKSNKSSNIGIDLRLNDSFLKPENLQDKKYSHEFLKYCFGFESATKIIDLRDFNVKVNETTKQLDITDAPIGQGVFDFNLLFNMLKVINFEGVLIIPQNCDAQGVQKILDIAKKHDYAEKTEEDIKEYIEYKRNKAKGDGTEFAVL